MAQQLAIRVAVCSRVVADLEAPLDHGNGAFAVGEHLQNLGLVDRLGARHADVHVDLHGLERLAERGRDRKRVVPERIAERAAGSLGRIGAANVGAHADLEHHAFLCHWLVQVAEDRCQDRGEGKHASACLSAVLSPLHPQHPAGAS